MSFYFVKLIITAAIIVIVSEVAKKSSLLAAIIISLPLISLLAFIWIYLETKNIEKIISLSYSTLIMVIPSITFFLVLPVMLKFKYNFSISLISAVIVTSAFYYIFLYILKKYGITI
tara:strand:- start:613 stop:963 length:351 start_codon:yes stop_codon:yes gene_type:complete